MFSTFLLLALLFGAFFLAALRGAFFFGSGCLTVSAALPASRLLRRAGADALGQLQTLQCFRDHNQSNEFRSTINRS